MQVADFALEVMQAQPLVLCGNSIGGGICAGVASNLRPICRGLVLCNWSRSRDLDAEKPLLAGVSSSDGAELARTVFAAA